MASEDPAADSGLKAVSLLERHSLLAYNIAPAASLEAGLFPHQVLAPASHAQLRVYGATESG